MPAEFEKIVKELIPEIRKQYPKKTDEEIHSTAYAIATNIWKKKYGKAP